MFLRSTICVAFRCRGGEASGVYISLSGAWMFTDLGEHANAFIVRTLSSDTSDREFRDVALATMIVDGTDALVWRFDLEALHVGVPEKLDHNEARRARCWVPVSGCGAAYVRRSPVGRCGAADVKRSRRCVGVRAARGGSL